MACLRSLSILNEIYTLFKEDCLDLWDALENRPRELAKLQLCINLDGTVTIALPCENGSNVYVRFNGSGTVELWSAARGTDVFWIEEADHKICSDFRELLKQHGFEFCGGAALEESYGQPTIFEYARFIGLPQQKGKKK